MKKIFLMLESLLVLVLLFSSSVIYSDTIKAEDSIPKTINIQGKLTTDSGQPLSGKNYNMTFKIYEDSIEKFSTIVSGILDDNGLYSKDINISSFTQNFSKAYSFKVKISVDGKDIESSETNFASSPYAFYASTSTYTLKLDPENGEKLVNENFKGYIGDDSNIYSIKVDSASYSDNTLSVSTGTATGKKGYVWGITDNEGKQEWTNNIELNVSTATWALSLDPNIVYESTITWASNAVNATTATYATNLASDFKLQDTNFETNKVYTATVTYATGLKNDFKLADGNFDTEKVYASTVAWASNAVNAATAESLASSFKLTDDNFDNTKVYVSTVAWASNAVNAATAESLASSFKLTDDNFDNTKVYASTVTWSSNAVNAATAESLASSFKLINDNFNSSVEYTNLKLVDGNFKRPNEHTYDIKVATATYVETAPGDLAEIYKSTEKLVPGDVVSIDTTKDNAIVKTKVAEDTLVAGVISTEPGLLINTSEKGYKLALVGKVPTKVCNEGGNIKRGDLLVSASIAGYAKKAGDNPKAGTVIGKALQNFDSQKGTILVLVNLQ